MANNDNNKVKIPGELESAAVGGIVAAASAIYDEAKGKKQSELNTEYSDAVAEIEDIDNRLTQVEELGQITIGAEDRTIANDSDFTNPTTAQRAKIPTVGAVLNGMNEGVYDVTTRNHGATFTSLSEILSSNNLDTLIPTSWRKGGMSIKFVDSSDNKYVQFRCMAQNFTTDVTQWQGVDGKPIPGSHNLVESGGVAKIDMSLVQEINIAAIYTALTSIDTDNIVVELNLGHDYEYVTIDLATGAGQASITRNVFNGALNAGNYAWKVPYNNESYIRFYIGNSQYPADSSAKICIPDIIEDMWESQSPIKSELKNLSNNLKLYTCASTVNSAQKEITSNGYSFFEGGCFYIKFTYSNDVNDCTLKVGDATAKPLYFNGVRASSNNTWNSGEIVRVRYDGEKFLAERMDCDRSKQYIIKNLSVSGSSQSLGVLNSRYLPAEFDIRINPVETTAVFAAEYVQLTLLGSSTQVIGVKSDGTPTHVVANDDNAQYLQLNLAVRKNQVSTAGVISLVVESENLLWKRLKDAEQTISQLGDTYIQKNQGAINSGKYMVVGADGIVIPSDGGGSDPSANAVKLHTSKNIFVGANELINPTIPAVTGWSGDITNGLTHNSGTDALEIQYNTTQDKSYLIEFDLSIQKPELFLQIGDSPEIDTYNGTTSVKIGFVSEGGYIKFRPDSESTVFTISNLTLKEIVSEESAVETIPITIGNVDNGTMTDNLTGYWNVAIGYEDTLNENIYGSRNIGIGHGSLSEFKGGTRNIGLGTFSNAHLQYGEHNIAIGADSFYRITAGSDNVAIGFQAITGNDDAGERINNIAIGTRALAHIGLNSKNNVAIGVYASYYNDSATSDSVAVGFKTLYKTRGKRNVAVGSQAMSIDNAGGQNNVAIGYYAQCAASDNSAVTNAIAIGSGARATKNNQVVIGNASHDEFVLGTKKLIFNNDNTITWESIS